MIGVGRPLPPEILGQIDRVESEIADFEPIFACSTLAVRPSEKSSIKTNRNEPMNQWAQDKHRTLFLSPQGEGGGLINAKCPKFEQ